MASITIKDVAREANVSVGTASMVLNKKDKVKDSVDINIVKEDVEVRKAVEFIKANANITETEKTLKEFEEELRKKNRERDGHDHGGGDGLGEDYGENDDADE